MRYNIKLRVEWQHALGRVGARIGLAMIAVYSQFLKLIDRDTHCPQN